MIDSNFLRINGADLDPELARALAETQYYEEHYATDCSVKVIHSCKKMILNSSEYGELLKDPNLLFHGINKAIWKIPSILKFGILSMNAATKQKVILGLNYGSQNEHGVIKNGYNGNDFISCARSPVHDDSIGGYDAGAFELFIRHGIAFVINGVSGISSYQLQDHNSGISGEALIEHSIGSGNIIGLIISDELLDKKITEINFLEGGALNTFHLRCQSLLEYIKDSCDAEEISQLRTKVERPLETEEDEKRLEQEFNKLLQRSILKKFGTDTIRLVDFIRSIVPADLKLFTSKGFEIK